MSIIDAVRIDSTTIIHLRKGFVMLCDEISSEAEGDVVRH